MISHAERGTEIKDLVRRIHSRTHLNPSTIEVLLKRTGNWNKEIDKEGNDIVQKYLVCFCSGEPTFSEKFSLSKLHMDFNSRVYIDIMYRSSDMMFHVVDNVTEYSELAHLESRKVEVVLRSLKNIWILRHGCSVEICTDKEFD
eukprot:IDg11880t1